MKKVKIISIVGARPQFIKLAAVAERMSFEPFRKTFLHIIIHTGQHYDYEMSKIFFQELNLPEADYHLEVKSQLPSEQIGRMMEGIEKVLLKERPDIVVVYGDTNTTVAGAISAAHLKIPIAHIEAGLRSFRRDMPEEINRVLTDRISSLFFCPTKTAVQNLKREGQTKNVYFVGDVMYDVFLSVQKCLKQRQILNTLGVCKKHYLLMTVHRKENLRMIKNLIKIFECLATLKETIIFPVHPGTQRCLNEAGCDVKKFKNIKAIKPIGYLDMLYLEKNARKIITDSGGVQKEAYWNKTPCIVLRDETEWKELTTSKCVILVGNDEKKLLSALNKDCKIHRYNDKIFGNGNAADKILDKILEWSYLQ
ncbi:MAG: UDP-N-acetylglucosamine 2-epimerase (non-hydrolyzing) [Candidatus Omnitrophica bacterium]|nr:UDP-N-acetylglucosamine 2-epimerase (non-hydrolyzing) [Candidatus Omnitrophota bacterium]